MAMEFYIKMMV